MSLATKVRIGRHRRDKWRHIMCKWRFNLKSLLKQHEMQLLLLWPSFQWIIELKASYTLHILHLPHNGVCIYTGKIDQTTSLMKIPITGLWMGHGFFPQVSRPCFIADAINFSDGKKGSSCDPKKTLSYDPSWKSRVWSKKVTKSQTFGSVLFTIYFM